MRKSFLTSGALLLLAALPAMAQSLDSEITATIRPTGSRFNDLLGKRVGFRDGRTGRVVDLTVNDDGGVIVVIRSRGDLVNVPWRDVRFGVPAVSNRILRATARLDRVPNTTLRTRLDNGESRLERFSELSSRPQPSVAIVVPGLTVGRPALLYEPAPALRLDSLYDRGALMTTPSDRISDLLKDRFEAHRAPPSRPWLRPVPPPVPVHSSVR